MVQRVLKPLLGLAAVAAMSAGCFSMSASADEAVTKSTLAKSSANADVSNANDRVKKEVSARKGWQHVIRVREGDTVSVRVYGRWTVDNRLGRKYWVGPSGSSDWMHERIGAHDRCHVSRGGYDTGNYGALLARIGNHDPFSMSEYTNRYEDSFTADYSGRLEMRINDRNACLGDNRGSMTVVVKVTRNWDNDHYDDGWGRRPNR